MKYNIFDLYDTTSSTALFPDRQEDAISGSTFIHENMNLNGTIRESNVLNEILNGNIPNFLRNLKPITILHENDSITYLVTSDVLSIGSDDDYVRMPMNAYTAQTIADKYDCSLPTTKMVYDIWQHSVNKLAPLPWGPPYSGMSHTDRIGIHNERIQKQLINSNYKDLISGHKKDIVLTNKLSPNNPDKRVAIYGWIQTNGKPIQGLNASDHEDLYQDYSHGVRLIANDVFVNGNYMRLNDVFTNNKLVSLVSNEGLLSFTRY